MKIRKLINFLEKIAPPSYQESYDNSGLIVGNANEKITGVLICLDSTEEVINEAIEKKCNLIVAHHPIVFRGIKKLTGKNYVERVIIKAIQYNIAIYAIHTNLDNMYHNGVNAKIAKKLTLINTRILSPKQKVKKLFTFVPISHSDKVRKALFKAGAGSVSNTKQLSYATVGMGTGEKIGQAEVKIEVLFPSALQNKIVRSLLVAHPYKTVPYDIVAIENTNLEVGSGMIGTLKKPIPEKAFLRHLKKRMKTNCIRHTQILGKPIRKVALCGGAGGFLLKSAIAQGADIFITADYKYHEFFDADGKIIIADIGHFESEQFTIKLLYKLIKNKFSTFAAHCTKVNTNPVRYF